MERLQSEFDRAVAIVVRAVPKGRVISYGEVAARAGWPGAARAVVQALYRAGRAGLRLPWWRVLRSDGTIAPAMRAEQAPRLEAEGWREDGLRKNSRGRGRRTPPARSN